MNTSERTPKTGNLHKMKISPKSGFMIAPISLEDNTQGDLFNKID